LAEQRKDSENPLWMLGVVMTIPLILFSGPVAGFLLGHFVLVKGLGLSETIIPWAVGLGFIAAGIKVVNLIQRIRRSDLNRKS
jgi:hypothetical protein